MLPIDAIVVDAWLEVIERIRSVAGEVLLLVVDCDTDKMYRSQQVVITGSASDIEVIVTPTSNLHKSAAVAANNDDNCKHVNIVVLS